MANDQRKIGWANFLAGALIVLAACAAYHGIFSFPLVFDDGPSIQNNATIRHLWPLWSALSPPRGGLPVSGRPVVNLSLALNYAISGTEVWSYHALNLAIHILAGLTLFGIIRRTIEGSRFREKLAGDSQSLTTSATSLAFAVALLWTVHPLQTESVTYISQRAESLMGLFYLLTLYCFIRGADDGEGGSVGKDLAPSPRFLMPAFRLPPSYFRLLSVLCCLLGMATKEVMVSAPLIVLLYDRTFISGGFGGAWRRRRGYYLGLACTWLLLAWLVAGTGSRGGSAGFGTAVPWSEYAVTQFRAIAHYLRLSIWPHPLVFYYGQMLGGAPVELVWGAMVVAGLAVATVWAIGKAEGGRRKAEVRNQGSEIVTLPPSAFRLPPLGFLGAFFFAILAPTSLVPVATETMAEHRMYLPLAAVIAVIVWGIFRLLRPLSAAGVCVALAIVLGVATARRNEVYRSDVVLWDDTVSKVPGDAVGRTNLGLTLAHAGRIPEAMIQYEQALKLKPDFSEAHYSMGLALAQTGRMPDAISQYEEALRLKPDYPEAHFSLGNAFGGAGRFSEAAGQYDEALRLRPDYAEAHASLGLALAGAGKMPEAISQYEQALKLRPDFPEARAALAQARNNLGIVLAGARRLPEAVAQFEEALRLEPGLPESHYNLGLALAQQGRFQEARGQFEQALRLKPDYPEARDRLNQVLKMLR